MDPARVREIEKRIALWRESKEYGRLSEQMRCKLEKQIFKQELRAPAIHKYLAHMTMVARALWPEDEKRIPFYEQEWIARKLLLATKSIEKKKEPEKRVVKPKGPSNRSIIQQFLLRNAGLVKSAEGGSSYAVSRTNSVMSRQGLNHS